MVTAFLESFFARYVEYDFTADLEEQLDRISNNEIAWRELLRDFWRDFTAAVGDIKELRITQVIDALDEMLAPHLFPARADGTDPRKCPNCETGKLSLKLGRFGGFIGCTNYPECRYTRQFSAGSGNGDGGMRKLGVDPATGLDVTVRSGRFGPYIQLGEPGQDADGKPEKPKRAGLPKGVSPDDVELDRALGLLSLPREVGKHPDDGEPILAGVGRFGPYVQHGKTYANINADEDVLTVGLNRAVTLIEEKKAQGPRKGRFGADPGRSLGDHPRQGRTGRGEERPLRTLCQPRRGQCHPPRRHCARGHHARTGHSAARRPGGARRRQEGRQQESPAEQEGRSRQTRCAEGRNRQGRRSGAAPKSVEGQTGSGQGSGQAQGGSGG